MQSFPLRRLSAGALLLLSGLGHAACTDGQATGGKVYAGVQLDGALDRLRLLCAPQSTSTAYTGTVSYADGDARVTTVLSASATADNSGMHAAVSSKPTPNPHSGIDPLGAFPGYALAQAGSALTFTLIAPAAASPNARVPVAFDVFGNGTLEGARGYFAGYSAYELSFSSNGTRFTQTGFFRDSNGVEDGNYMRNFSQGPKRSVEFGATFTGWFAPGLNGFNLRLDLIAQGDAAADFSHTAGLGGLRVAPGYQLDLPAGLFTQDANDPSHYILTSLLPVPEPTTAALFAMGWPVLYGLARRRGHRQAVADSTG